MNSVYFGDNLDVLKSLPDNFVNLIYIDPPFNTGNTQARETGAGIISYRDNFKSLVDFLEPRLKEAYRVLSESGSFYFHIDYREVHYCKLLLDYIFGKENFLNEIIWSYDYGGRSKRRWAAKHDNILFYVKDRTNYCFNYDEIDRIPYMAPGLVGEEKTKAGKRVTDTWWHTIVPTRSKEKTGYPTQKPLGIVDRMVKVSSNVGDLVLDFFAGSGTTGESCRRLGRKFILVDNNQQALDIMRKRFGDDADIRWIDIKEGAS